MAVKFLDRVWQETATTGTGTITLGAALPGFLTAAEAGAVDTDEVEFVIRDGDDFELSRGIFGDSGTSLTRETVIRSKIGGVAGTTKLDLSGSAQVMVVASAGEMLGRSGGTMTGPLITAASTTDGAGLRIPHGVAPSSPVNGDVWSTDTALMRRSDGTTAQIWDDKTLTLVSQEDAEAGASTNLRLWSAQRVAQAIAAQTEAPILTKEYVSAQQALTTGGALTLSHGLGVKPKMVVFRLHCITAENGYSVGDEVELTMQAFIQPAGSAQASGGSIKLTSTEIQLRYGNGGGGVFVGHIFGTGVIAWYTNANWRMTVRAYA